MRKDSLAKSGGKHLAKFLMNYRPASRFPSAHLMHSGWQVRQVPKKVAYLSDDRVVKSELYQFPYGSPLNFQVDYAPPADIDKSYQLFLPSFYGSLEDNLMLKSTFLILYSNSLMELISHPKWKYSTQMVAISGGLHVVNSHETSHTYFTRALPYVPGRCLAPNPIRMVVIDTDGEVYYLPEGRNPTFRDEYTDNCFREKSWGGAYLDKAGFQKGKLVKVLRRMFETAQGFHRLYYKCDAPELSEAIAALNDSKFAEALTNDFKSAYKDLGDFSLVHGGDIREGYCTDNYDPSFNLGTMGTSCMNWGKDFDDGVNCEALLFYSKNSNASDDSPVKLLTLRNPEDGTIRGRALLWSAELPKYDDQKVKALDRVYGNDVVRELFKRYASSMGWAYKINDNSSTCSGFRFPDGLLKTKDGGNVTVRSAEFYIPNVTWHGDLYPYMDTMAYTDECEWLSNETRDDSYSLELQEVPSSQQEEREPEGVYVPSRGEYFDEDEVVYIGGEYHLLDDCVFLQDSNEYVLEENHEAYFECAYSGCLYSIESLLVCEHDDEYYYDYYKVEIEVDGDTVSLFKNNVNDYVRENELHKLGEGVYATEEPELDEVEVDAVVVDPNNELPLEF